MEMAGQNGPLHAKRKLWVDCTDKEQSFILNFIKTGDFLDSYELAGYSVNNRRAARANARQLFMRLRDTIYDQVVVRIGSQVPMAMNVYDLILQPGSQASLALKQKTAADVLDRAGFKESQEIIITDQRTPEQMASQEVDTEITALLKTLGLDSMMAEAKEIDGRDEPQGETSGSAEGES